MSSGGKHYEVSEILGYEILPAQTPWVLLTLKYNPGFPAYARASSLVVRTRG